MRRSGHASSKDEERKPTRNRVKLLIAALTVALTMSLSGVAFVAINEGPGKGNPDTTASGKCPPGQKRIRGSVA